MTTLLSSFPEAVAQQHTPDGVADALLDEMCGLGVRHIIIARLGANGKNREATIVASRGIADWPEPDPDTGACSLFPATHTIIDPKVTQAVAWSLADFPSAPPKISSFLTRHKLIEGVAVPVTAFDLTRGAIMLYGEEPEIRNHLAVIEVMAQAAYVRACKLHPVQWVENVRSDARNLTLRERECLRWAANGKTDAEIGRILGISPHTAFAHIKSAGDKLKASSRAQAVFNGLITFQIPML